MAEDCLYKNEKQWLTTNSGGKKSVTVDRSKIKSPMPTPIRLTALKQKQKLKFHYAFCSFPKEKYGFLTFCCVENTQ